MENERKNTEPAVALHNGPKGTKRKVSKDGKYTADLGAGKVEDYYLTQELDLGEEKPFLDPDFRTHIARESLEKTVLKNYAGLANPEFGERLVIQAANSYRDKHLGIDYEVGIQNANGNFVISTLVDAKIDDFNIYTDYKGEKENMYQHLSGGSLALYHYIEGDEDVTLGSGLNVDHKNNIYNFTFPKESKINPETLDELETINIDRADMDVFLDDFVRNNKYVNRMIRTFFNRARDMWDKNSNKYIDATYVKTIGDKRIIEVEVPIPNTRYFARFWFTHNKYRGKDQKTAHIILPKEFLMSDKNYFPTSTYDRTLYK